MKKVHEIYPKGIKSAVKKITVVKNEKYDPGDEHLRYFADGLPGILFYQAEENIYFNQEYRGKSGIIYFGQTITPIEFVAYGPYKLIVFHLYSHVTNALFGINANQYTDGCIDYELLLGVKSGSTLLQKLQENQSTPTQVSIIFKSLQDQLEKIKSTNSCSLHWVIEQLYSTNGSISFDFLLDRLNMSQRTFERRFLQHVGVTPSLFKRIVQFNAAMNHLKTGSFQKLTDVAFDNGFSDQSHFSRTFKEFTGLTAKEYLKSFNKYWDGNESLQDSVVDESYFIQ